MSEAVTVQEFKAPNVQKPMVCVPTSTVAVVAPGMIGFWPPRLGFGTEIVNAS